MSETKHDHGDEGGGVGDVARLAEVLPMVSVDREIVLGQGSFGVVYPGVLLSSGEICAVKTMVSPTAEATEMLKAEIAIHRQLRHKHICALLGDFFIVVSFCLRLSCVFAAILRKLLQIGLGAGGAGKAWKSASIRSN